MKNKAISPWTVTFIFMLIIIAAFVAVNQWIPNHSKTKATLTPLSATDIPASAEDQFPVTLTSTPDLLAVIATLLFGDFSPSTQTQVPPSTKTVAIVFTITPTPTLKNNFTTPTKIIIDTKTFTTVDFTTPSSPTFTPIPPSPTFTPIPPSPTFTRVPSSPTQIIVPNKKACNDNEDNDYDGYIDMKDPQCKNPGDNDESQ